MSHPHPILTLAAAFFLAAAWGPSGATVHGDPSVVKIVSSLPRSGSSNAQTTSMANGIRMAISEVEGRVAGMTVLYEDWDDASAKKGDWDPEVESANADRAIADPDCVAYIGTYNSGAAKISMPKLNVAGLLMISPGNTYPGLTKPGLGKAVEPWIYRPSGAINYFRVCPADDIQGAVAARWARRMGVRRTFVLDDRSLYGKGVADVFDQTAVKIGIEVLGHEGLDPKAQDYKAVMTKVKSLGPDLLYFGGTTQTNAPQVVKDMRAVGLTAPFMGTDGIYETAFIQASGAQNVEGGAYVTFGGLPADRLTGLGAEYYRRYRERFGMDPEGYGVYGYEAGRVALEAIRRAGRKDRGAIVAACAALREFEGAIGRFSFDENGDTTITTMSGFVVRNGAFEFVDILGD